MERNNHLILGIESSCDDTSVAVLKGTQVLSNVTANQSIHEKYGGVVPELASRAHQENIIPVMNAALNQAGIKLQEIDAIAFTLGPGLMGSLVVGTSFAKALAIALNKPFVPVHHMKAHVLAHFIHDPNQKPPEFPFLCLTVSGGHTQIIVVRSALDMEIIGSTIDDAAGEAFDKSAKMLGLPYPGGPLIDEHAKNGDPNRFKFSKPKVGSYNYSFSGLKTSILYQLRDLVKENPNFISENLDDLCASIQNTIIAILLEKLKKAQLSLQITEIAICGGVAANAGLRSALKEWEILDSRINVHIPKFEYCTDNAAMIAMAGSFLYEANIIGTQALGANPRLSW